MDCISFAGLIPPNTMKKRLLLVFVSLSIWIAYQTLSDNGQVYSNTNTANPGHAGDPAGQFKTCRQCHAGPTAVVTPGLISSNIPSAGYTPGAQYQITASISEAGRSKFGFSISPQNSSGNQMGTLMTANTECTINGAGKYITHNNSSTAGSGSRTWTFNWTAPAAGSGQVTFYGAFNAANSNNGSSGDNVYTSTLVVEENTALSITEEVSSNAFQIYPNPVTDGLLFVQSAKTLQGQTQIEIFNLEGAKVYEEQLQNFNGANSHRISLRQDLASGIYIVRIQNQGESESRKLVIR